MSTEFIAIVILIIMGGAIAYFGDWIGLTMGKRRLSLVGLRPRHTARVFTITFGAIIAVGTFLVALGIDPVFRLAVRKGAQIVHRNHLLSAQNRQLQVHITVATGAAQKAQADEAAAKQAQSIAELQYQADEKKLALDNGAIARTALQLSSVRNQLSATSSNLSSMRVQLAQAKKQSTELAAQIASDESFVNTHLVPEMKQKSQSAPIYGGGQEIGRTVIRSDQSVEEIKQQIRGFLLHLSVETQSRGATRGANGRFVEVASVEILKQGAAAQPTFANEADSVDALADEIAANEKSSSVVVIARALGNAFAGEQAVIIMRPYFNLLVLPRGSVLGQVTVPVSDNDPAKMLTDLQVLLQRARSSAIRAGVIPVKSAHGNESEIGQTSIADLYNVVDEVRAIKGPAMVTATVAQDTYSADRLALSFTVTPATTESSTSSGP